MNVILHKNSTSFKMLLIIAGCYHLLWGIAAVLFPSFFFLMAEQPIAGNSQLFQVTGFYNAILGAGFLLASSNAIRHWRIVLLGFASKMAVVLFFAYSFFTGATESVLFHMLIVNYVVWLFPFGVILYNAYKQQFVLDNELIKMNHGSADELLDIFITNKHHTVKELAEEQPVLLVFLRHFGCVFCRETLQNIKRFKSQIEHQGTRIVLVNMMNERDCFHELQKYGLGDVEYICDSESLLYKAFKLRRGTLSQLFGVKVFLRGFYLWLTKGLFLPSGDSGDSSQMPGIFLIYKGAVVKQFIHQSVADEPPYLELAANKPRMAS